MSSNNEQEQKEPLLKQQSSTPRGPPTPPPPPPPPRPPPHKHDRPREAATSLVLDVERAETANVRLLEEQEVQQQQQQSQSNSLLNRATDSFLKLYDHVNFAGTSSSSSAAAAAGMGASPSSLPPRGPPSSPRSSLKRGTGAPQKASFSRATSDTTAHTSNRSRTATGSGITGTATPPRPTLFDVPLLSDGGRKPRSLRDVARHVQLAKSLSDRRVSLDRTGQPSSGRDIPPHRRELRRHHHKRHPSGSTAAEILQAIQDTDEVGDDYDDDVDDSAVVDVLKSPILPRKPGLRETVHRIEPYLGPNGGGGGGGGGPLFGNDSLEEWECDDDDDIAEDGEPLRTENRPTGATATTTTPSAAAQYGSLPLGGSSTVASTSQGDLDDEDDSSLEFLSHRFSLTRRLRRRAWRKHWRTLRYCCRPDMMWIQLREALRHSLVWIALPFFVAAWVLYYTFGNPELDFLPGSAKVSWWCNFVGRQLLTLELARFSSWILLDGMVMTRWGARLLGSYITFFCLQSTGWPLVVTSWGIWDLLLLHGDNRFQSHWLYWTGWKIYSIANSGRYILSSVFYLRLLVSMILLGLATATKRTILAIRFGNRQLGTYCTCHPSDWPLLRLL